jgi:hypothetical protein
MNAIWRVSYPHHSLFVKTAYLHKADSHREANGQVVALRPFCRKNRIRDKEEDTKWQDCDTNPTCGVCFRSYVYRSHSR